MHWRSLGVFVLRLLALLTFLFVFLTPLSLTVAADNELSIQDDNDEDQTIDADESESECNACSAGTKRKPKTPQGQSDEIYQNLPDLDSYNDEAYQTLSEVSPEHRTQNWLGCGVAKIPRGAFWMGDTSHETYVEDGETPLRRVAISKSFYMDRCEVTNAQFLEFYASQNNDENETHTSSSSISSESSVSNYETEAEKYAWSFVFSLMVSPEVDGQIKSAVQAAPWWIPVPKADFRHPFGPDRDFNAMMNHPVTHVGWTDAKLYCQWKNGRLPSEAEWEYASRGGLDRSVYPWGNESRPNGEIQMNIFTGIPYQKDDGEDGFPATAPVGSYSANGFGLFDMTGNVWEWVQDWWSPMRTPVPKGKRVRNPLGPKHGRERVMKGGSYMCHADTCHRYRCSGRSHAEMDSSTGNLGFRCVYDSKPKVRKAEKVAQKDSGLDEILKSEL